LWDYRAIYLSLQSDFIKSRNSTIIDFFSLSLGVDFRDCYGISSPRILGLHRLRSETTQASASSSSAIVLALFVPRSPRARACPPARPIAVVELHGHRVPGVAFEGGQQPAPAPESAAAGGRAGVHADHRGAEDRVPPQYLPQRRHQPIGIESRAEHLQEGELFTAQVYVREGERDVSSFSAEM
jgi:hypothetical protein